MSDTDTLYQEIILDHYKHPHGRGLRDPYDAEAHHVNPTCGDEITMRVLLRDGTVRDVSYDGMGCSISQASASVLYDLLRGRTVPDALARHAAFTELLGGRGQVRPDEDVLEDAVAFAGVARYPARVKCALLAWMAFKDATARAAHSDNTARPADGDNAARAAGNDNAARAAGNDNGPPAAGEDKPQEAS